MSNEVRAIGELLGRVPLYIANEGHFVIIAPSEQEQSILDILAVHYSKKV